MSEVVASYTLKRPVKVGDDLLRTLDFTEPTLEMLEAMVRAAKESEVKGIMKLISMSANQPIKIVFDIKAVDLPGIMETLRPFLPAETPGLSGGEDGDVPRLN